jgi:hypothetical protein
VPSEWWVGLLGEVCEPGLEVLQVADDRTVVLDMDQDHSRPRLLRGERGDATLSFARIANRHQCASH